MSHFFGPICNIFLLIITVPIINHIINFRIIQPRLDFANVHHTTALQLTQSEFDCKQEVLDHKSVFNLMNFRSIRSGLDFGNYSCVAENSLGTFKSEFIIITIVSFIIVTIINHLISIMISFNIVNLYFKLSSWIYMIVNLGSIPKMKCRISIT